MPRIWAASSKPLPIGLLSTRTACFGKGAGSAGGFQPVTAERLRELEKENNELKKIVAEQTLDIRILKDINSKNW